MTGGSEEKELLKEKLKVVDNATWPSHEHSHLIAKSDAVARTRLCSGIPAIAYCREAAKVIATARLRQRQRTCDQREAIATPYRVKRVIVLSSVFDNCYFY